MNGIEFTLDSNSIATLVVNRPQVRNGLDWAAMDSFAAAIKRVANNKRIRALIITGAGQTFVSGGDLKALAPYTKRKDGMRLATVMGKALRALRGLHCPTIAAINGPARGGGAEIAVACDQRIMAEDADIGFVHAKLGITTAWGGARYLLQLVGYPTALELLSTARVLAAGEAKAIGLVGHLTAPGGALEAARTLAAEMAQHPAEAVQAAKRLLQFAVASPLVARHAERRLFSFLWDTEYRRQAVARFLKRG
ncbi:MAG: enoyl-CoA hydratase/isomerase family protein [Anaerolineales bacterium]|nr:enoyl-CoA hydratase/isomerase family protein [Anaerolineales bacterium]MCL4256897.1 enoyl-CoA hydratase/isomerase family protein [Anaerolineales bacterium]